MYYILQVHYNTQNDLVPIQPPFCIVNTIIEALDEIDSIRAAQSPKGIFGIFTDEAAKEQVPETSLTYIT
jgi:hypothetical protein